MRMRRSDIKFYVTVIALVAIIYVVIRGSRQNHDFREIAKQKLQLTSETKPLSCGDSMVDNSAVYTQRITVIVSTQSTEEAVITQTVNSILAHTDPAVLEEIIIATDKRLSDEKKNLLAEEFGPYDSVVKIMHGNSEERLRNKLVIGHLAVGEIVVFIDDTVVVTSNYLAPLLEALYGYPERIAVPSFEYLTDLTVSVEKSWTQMKWIFGWDLDIQAYELGFQELASKPENKASPAMVFDSSAFALRKTYLEKLGSMKNGMQFLTSIDLSFATWLCGDGAYVVPCSRVAKVDSSLTLSIKDQKSKRFIAERYFTEKYLQVFKRVNGESLVLTKDDQAHVVVEQNFQKKCPKDFDWYMKNVAKNEVFVPSKEALAYGYFNSNSGRICFRQTPAMLFLGYQGCKMHARGKMAEYLNTGQLRMGIECITGSDKSYMVTDPCDYEKEAFKWEATKYRQFKDKQNRCISHATDPYPEEHGRQVLMYTECVDESKPENLRWQKWNSFIWLH